MYMYQSPVLVCPENDRCCAGRRAALLLLPPHADSGADAAAA